MGCGLMAAAGFFWFIFFGDEVFHERFPDMLGQENAHRLPLIDYLISVIIIPHLRKLLLEMPRGNRLLRRQE